ARLKEELKQKRTEWTARVKEDEKREERLASLASSIEKVQKKRKILKERQKTLEQEKINAKLRQELISARPKLEAKLKTLEATLERANKGLTTNDASELIKKKEAIEEKHFRIEKQLKLHKWLIDDPLSNKGLKAFIFQALLQNVNEQLKKYGKYLGYYIEFSIDLESGNRNFEAVVYSNDQIRMYEDLSGGQKQLVDVCLAFAIHDTITETKDLNILLMDEVFESLDADNIELVSELIQHKAKDTSI